MSIIDVDLKSETESRYLAYALSVVSSRALPDVRDGLKPVQRRILYAMLSSLNLKPEKAHRKSAAVVGEVLARFHPHGDSACYEAMVRMAQDFSFRYPLVDGQGNFGSLDGDSAAAYRYTEAKLTELAIEVLGDVWEETVDERDNFDQTTKEPVVLPSRIPNLLINGASGIAVGMATSIPPHNLKEVIKAIELLIEDPEVSYSKILGAIKGPDFPTACSILNSKQELREIYESGRGAIRMRGDYMIEEGKRGKTNIVITSIPYAIDKSSLITKIADLIISKKIPQLVDLRDESTEVIRIVLELAQGADPDKAMAYIYKNTPLQNNFNVNLTALIPTDNPYVGKPDQLSLRAILQHFIDFRISVTRKKLNFELQKLLARVHLLEGLLIALDVLDEIIEIVRKSDGRQDSATRLVKRFSLTETQALFIVDLRIYQLSKTSVVEVRDELKEKQTRIKSIKEILSSEKLLKNEILIDLQRLSSSFGDERRSKVLNEYEEIEISADEFVEHEDVHVVVTRDGWVKRIRSTNDPYSSRIREGDEIVSVLSANTRQLIGFISTKGNLFATKVIDIPYSTGYGDPIQKIFKFSDGEQIACSHILDQVSGEILLFTQGGFGVRLSADHLTETKKNGKRLMRVLDDDLLSGLVKLENDLVYLVTEDGYGLLYHNSEIPLLSGAGKGVILQKVGNNDKLVSVLSVTKKETLSATSKNGKVKDLQIKSLTIGSRAQKGSKIYDKATGIKEVVVARGQMNLL